MGSGSNYIIENALSIRMTSKEASIQTESLRVAIDNYETDNMSVAVDQFLKLAEHNCDEAFLYLSLIFRDGDGVQKDELVAARYKKQYVSALETKAAAGVAEYRLKLAYVLQFGDGTAVDSSRAFSLFMELASEGCGEAQFHLSRIFARGTCGQRQDEEMELYWLNQATQSEWPLAIYHTAMNLAFISDDSQSLERAKQMMQRSSQLGCWQATEYLQLKID
jgi:TPR repeat protein